MTPQQNASAVQLTTQNTWSPQMAAQFNALAPSPMTPQQHLAILLQPMTPSEILISRSPHQGGVNWIFHDQITGVLRNANLPYMDPLAQQSASPSAPQPASTSALTMYQHPTTQSDGSAGTSDGIGRTTDDPYVTTTCSSYKSNKYVFSSTNTSSWSAD